MKKGIIVLITMIFVISFYSLESFSDNNEINILEELLNERIKVINEYLYEEHDFEKLRIGLEKIEENSLLESDLDILERITDNPTDYELAKSVKIENVIDFDLEDDKLELLAILKWTSYGYEGERNTLKKYEIQSVFIEQKMYLTNLKSIQ